MGLRTENSEKVTDLSLRNSREFKGFLEHFFSDLGYSVKKPRASANYGADLIFRNDKVTIAVKVKHNARPVGLDAIKDAVFARQFYETDEAWVIASRGFSQNAISAAQTLNIRLITSNDLESVAVNAKEESASIDDPIHALSTATLLRAIDNNADHDGYAHAVSIIETFKDVASSEDVTEMLDRAWCDGALRKRQTSSGVSYARRWSSDAWRKVREAENRRYVKKKRALHTEQTDAAITVKMQEITALEKDHEDALQTYKDAKARARVARLQSQKLKQSLEHELDTFKETKRKLSKLGLLDFSERREVKLALAKSEDRAVDLRRQMDEAQSRAKSLEQLCIETKTKASAQEAAITRARSDIIKIKVVQNRSRNKLEKAALQARIYSLMELWASPVTPAWCVENIDGIDDVRDARLALFRLTHTFDALNIGDERFVLTGPPSFQRNIDVMMNRLGIQSNARMVSKTKQNKIRLLVAVYKRMPSDEEGVTAEWIRDHCDGINTVAMATAVMNVGLETGYFVKEVKEVGSRKEFRYRKLQSIADAH